MYRILVVDDDPGVLESVSRLLRAGGFEVLEASDGAEGLELLRESDVDLVMLDIFMPYVDGMELTARIKEQIPDMKIIAMSGGGTVDKRDALDIALRFGANLALEKPFEPEELLADVRNLLASD